MSALELFGARMFRLMHAAEGNDLDALDVQNTALLAGVLEWVTMAAPCGPACVCQRVVSFPQDCLRAPDAVRAMVDALAPIHAD